MNTDPAMFSLFLMKCRDYIRPDHLLRVYPGHKIPALHTGDVLKTSDGLIDPLSPAAVLSFDAADAAIREGLNIGCMAHPSGLMVLDFDLIDSRLCVPESVIDYYRQNTLMVRSRSGGYQAVFLHDGETSDCKLYWDDSPAGDVRASGYFLAPGSWVDPAASLGRTNKGSLPGADGRYAIINELQPIRFDVSSLPAGLTLNTERKKIGEPRPEMPITPHRGPFFTADGVSLAFLRLKFDRVEKALTYRADDESAGDYAAAKDLARYGFDPATIAQIILYYRSRDKIDKRPEYAAGTAYKAWNEVKSAGKIYYGLIVDQWLREQVIWEQTGKVIPYGQ